jgi:hypothetical protein
MPSMIYDGKGYVMHEGTINVLNVLRPIGVAMASSNTFDPYKD